MKYRNHNGEYVSESEADNYDDYPHLKAGCASGPFDELDRAEEMRERGRRVIAGLRNDQQRRDEMKTVYRGYTIVKTPDHFEVRDASGKMVTWSYGLRGAQFFVDDIIETNPQGGTK